MAPVSLLVTGASGFLGAHYAAHALRCHADWTLVGQQRRTPIGLQHRRLRKLTCDLERAAAEETVARLEPEVVIHMAAAIGGDDVRQRNARMMKHLLGACQRSGAKLVYISSSQVGFERLNEYARSKLEDEQALGASDVPHVILRPAAPYGPQLPGHRPQREQSMHVLVRFIQTRPVVPVIGDGHYTRQPLHVSDFNRAIDHVIGRDRFQGQAFDMGGPQAYSMNQIVALLARLAGRRVLPIHLPKALFLLGANVVPSLSKDLMSTVDCDERVDNSAILAEMETTELVAFPTGARELL